MRGEHQIAEKDERIKVGSSPHARGTPVAYDKVKALGGIIPACAGNTPPPT